MGVGWTFRGEEGDRMQMSVKKKKSNIKKERWEVQGSFSSKMLLTEERSWLWWDISFCSQTCLHQGSVKLGNAFWYAVKVDGCQDKFSP